MQKNKSFQKPTKNSKEISNRSSKALLELSQITVHSKDKSNILHNLTERSGRQLLGSFQNSVLNDTQSKKAKQTQRPHSKKENYIRKNISLSNTVLKQIMQMSNSLPNNNNFQSSRLVSSENDLIVFSKKDLEKNKNSTQDKKSKKLLLYEYKQHQQKGMSKSKSTYGQAIKGETVLCSIRIHPLQQKNTNQSLSSSKKRESFDARRSSLSSRRSSINLFPQDDFSDSKIRQIKKSFLAKFSGTDTSTINQHSDQSRVENFLKKSPQSFQQVNKSEQKQIFSKPTCQNQTEITARQNKQIKSQYLFKLDELNVIEEDIRKDALKFIPFWDCLMQSERNLNKFHKKFQETKQQYEKLLNYENELKGILYQQNKKYIMNKRISNNNFNAQKQNILLEVQRIHTDVKKKVYKKDLEEMMIFNMKVVLPASELIESSVSCFDNRINSAINYSNITMLQLYEQLMNQKACKKYGMILKKQINNMNIYDNRTMNDYLKRLYELQVCFHRVQNQDPQNQVEYLDRIEDIVQKIEEVAEKLGFVKRDYANLEIKIEENQSKKAYSLENVEALLSEISGSIYAEYQLFQTGGRASASSRYPSQDSDINQSFCESDKTIQQFRELVQKKYSDLEQRYKKVKQQRRFIEDSLKSLE